MTEMKNEKKKMNTYVKYIGVLLLCATVGGFVGAFSPALLNIGVDNGIEGLVEFISRQQLPILLLLLVIEVVSLEYVQFKIRKMGKLLLTAGDEECDFLEYEIEKIGSFGVIMSNVCEVLLLLILSTGYTMEFIQSLENDAGGRYLVALFVFIAAATYCGIWQVRYVKAIQKIYPDKKGDPASMKFRKQWLESCDEAEKEAIYQSSYKTYLTIMKMIPILFIIAMFSHFVWNTGIMAIVMVGVIWIATIVTYSRSVVMKKGQKLNKE